MYDKSGKAALDFGNAETVRLNIKNGSSLTEILITTLVSLQSLFCERISVLGWNSFLTRYALWCVRSSISCLCLIALFGLAHCQVSEHYYVFPSMLSDSEPQA